MRTEKLHGLTLVSGMGGEGENGSALTPYGPASLAFRSWHKTQTQQLEESLKSLENQVAILESKYLEVSTTLTSVMEHLVKLLPSITNTTGTK